MDKRMITFRIDKEKQKALDAIATSLDRDRSYILNQAVEAYISTHQWHLEHIKEGLAQAKAGKFASAKQVRSAFSKWRK